MTKYNIGDKLYWATFNPNKPVYIECPDCGGTGRIRVILHDEEEVSIACVNCSRGFEPPSGRILVYENKPDVEEITITGMEVETGSPTCYKVRKGQYSNYIMEENRLFTDKEKAWEKARELHKKFVQEQKDRIFKKEKDTRTWAWNASYHRQCIKRAKHDLEYHTEKLKTANLKAKK